MNARRFTRCATLLGVGEAGLAEALLYASPSMPPAGQSSPSEVLTPSRSTKPQRFFPQRTFSDTPTEDQNHATKGGKSI
eukprot:151865-Amphidinium_carterae.1